MPNVNIERMLDDHLEEARAETEAEIRELLTQIARARSRLHFLEDLKAVRQDHAARET